MAIQEPRRPGGTTVPCSPLAPWCELISLLRPPDTYLRPVLPASPQRANILHKIGAKPQAGAAVKTDATLTGFVNHVLQFLTVHEAVDILREFRNPAQWKKNHQVLWSGMNQEVVQRWANKHGLATLSTALGRLKDPGHDACLRKSKSDHAWSKYMKGASALFSWCIAQNQGTVLLVTPPPGERFHPSGDTNLQQIEGPILAGSWGPSYLEAINIVHPQVADAADSQYQFWPKDDVSGWSAKFGGCSYKRMAWRAIKGWQPATLSRDISPSALTGSGSGQSTMNLKTDHFMKVDLAASLVVQISNEKICVSSCPVTSTPGLQGPQPFATSASSTLPALLTTHPAPALHSSKIKSTAIRPLADLQPVPESSPEDRKHWAKQQRRKDYYRRRRDAAKVERLRKPEEETGSRTADERQEIEGNEKGFQEQSRGDNLRHQQEQERQKLRGALDNENQAKKLGAAKIKAGNAERSNNFSESATLQAPADSSTRSEKKKKKKGKKITVIVQQKPLLKK